MYPWPFSSTFVGVSYFDFTTSRPDDAVYIPSHLVMVFNGSDHSKNLCTVDAVQDPQAPRP